MTPAEITAVMGGIAAITAAFFGGGKLKEKKLFKENGFERREDTITRSEHDLCRATRENSEQRIEKRIESNRAENKEDMNKLEITINRFADEGRAGREKIYDLIEGLTEKVYKQGG